MESFLVVVHYIVCIFLILVILLQSGKGADIGAAFGAGGSQTLFGPRGAATFLNKLTAGVAFVFLLTSLGLVHYSQSRIGQKSVLESEVHDVTPQTIPTFPETSPAQTQPTTQPTVQTRPTEGQTSPAKEAPKNAPLTKPKKKK